jgi:hypothetical protein
MKLLILMAFTVVSANVFAQDVTCITSVNSSATEVKVSSPITDGSGTWSSSEENNSGGSYTTLVEIKNNVISRMHIGLADGEGGLNRNIGPLTKTAELAVGSDHKISCKINN